MLIPYGSVLRQRKTAAGLGWLYEDMFDSCVDLKRDSGKGGIVRKRQNWKMWLMEM